MIKITDQHYHSIIGIISQHSFSYVESDKPLNLNQTYHLLKSTYNSAPKAKRMLNHYSPTKIKIPNLNKVSAMRYRIKREFESLQLLEPKQYVFVFNEYQRKWYVLDLIKNGWISFNKLES